MRALLSMLPSDAYGQVLLEVHDDVVLADLDAPARVTVQRIRPVPTEPTGTALSRAVSAWLAEWLPEEPDPHRSVGVWLGSTCATSVASQCFDLRSLVSTP